MLPIDACNAIINNNCLVFLLHGIWGFQAAFSFTRDISRALVAAASTKFKRYYFGTLKVITGRMTLSVLTASDLEPNLAQIKTLVGIPLAKFEDVQVELGLY